MGKNILAAVAAGAVAGLVAGAVAGVMTARDEYAHEVADLKKSRGLWIDENLTLGGRIIAAQSEIDAHAQVIRDLIAIADAFYCVVDDGSGQSVCQPSIGDCVYFAEAMRAAGQKPTPCWKSPTAFCTAGDNGDYCARDEKSCEQLRSVQVLNGAKMTPCKEKVGGT
jgi:hypothetical protein